MAAFLSNYVEEKMNYFAAGYEILYNKRKLSKISEVKHEDTLLYEL